MIYLFSTLLALIIQSLPAGAEPSCIEQMLKGGQTPTLTEVFKNLSSDTYHTQNVGLLDRELRAIENRLVNDLIVQSAEGSDITTRKKIFKTFVADVQTLFENTPDFTLLLYLDFWVQTYLKNIPANEMKYLPGLSTKAKGANTGEELLANYRKFGSLSEEDRLMISQGDEPVDFKMNKIFITTATTRTNFLIHTVYSQPTQTALKELVEDKRLFLLVEGFQFFQIFFKRTKEGAYNDLGFRLEKGPYQHILNTIQNHYSQIETLFGADFANTVR